MSHYGLRIKVSCSADSVAEKRRQQRPPANGLSSYNSEDVCGDLTPHYLAVRRKPQTNAKL